MSEIGKIGKLDLEELKRKPLPNKKQEHGIKIRFHESNIKKLSTPKIRIKPQQSDSVDFNIEKDIVEESARLEEKEVAIPQKKLVTIVDRRSESNIDRTKLLKRLEENNVFLVKTKKRESQMDRENQEEIIDTIKEPSISDDKIGTTFLEKIPEEDTEKGVEMEKIEETEKEVDETEKEMEKETEKPKKITIIRKKKATDTKKATKTFGDAVIRKADLMGDSVTNLLPKPVFEHRVKASPYYMTNRKLYIQKLIPMFSKYKKMLEDDELQKVSCDNQGKKDNKNFKLLIHQQVVRDYLNVYTPYRGLLLYHGLGSGKTCSSIAIAEGMKMKKKIFVLTLASLKANFFEQMKVCGDPIYKLNQYWEFVSTNGQPDTVALLSRALNLSMEFINKQ